MSQRYFLIFIAPLSELVCSLPASMSYDTLLSLTALSHPCVTHRLSWQVLGLSLLLPMHLFRDKFQERYAI